MTIDEFAPQVSFFFYTHNDFFEEIAKYRAGRRRWAHIVRERYGAQKASSEMFRTGVVCGGWTLQAQQPHNNIVRVAYQAMAAVLGGVQSMFTAAWDEPFALPTEESTTLALRTQQILAHETGVDAHRRSPRWVVLRRVADRRDGGEDRRDHGRPRRRAAAWSAASKTATCSG